MNLMAFNHYAKLKRIIQQQPPGWYILRINQPTTASNFRGEVKKFDHYYRLYSFDGQPIKYGKFQQIERLAKILQTNVEELPIVEKPDQLNH